MTKLITGKEYGFRVRAENRFGISEPIYSERIIARYPFGEFWAKILHPCLTAKFMGTTIVFSRDKKAIC